MDIYYYMRRSPCDNCRQCPQVVSQTTAVPHPSARDVHAPSHTTLCRTIRAFPATFTSAFGLASSALPPQGKQLKLPNRLHKHVHLAWRFLLASLACLLTPVSLEYLASHMQSTRRLCIVLQGVPLTMPTAALESIMHHKKNW